MVSTYSSTTSVFTRELFLKPFSVVCQNQYQTNWAIGEPSNTGYVYGQDYVIMQPWNGQWNDLYHLANTHVVCVQPAQPSDVLN